MKFIVFNTKSQAKNFVKRQVSYYHSEGCGCCHQTTHTIICSKTNKVLFVDYGEWTGSAFYNITVLGRIK